MKKFISMLLLGFVCESNGLQGSMSIAPMGLPGYSDSGELWAPISSYDDDTEQKDDPSPASMQGHMQPRAIQAMFPGATTQVWVIQNNNHETTMRNFKTVCFWSLIHRTPRGGFTDDVLTKLENLIQQGADINASDTAVSWICDDGDLVQEATHRPLEWAFVNGHADLVEFLLGHKAKIFSRDIATDLFWEKLFLWRQGKFLRTPSDEREYYDALEHCITCGAYVNAPREIAEDGVINGYMVHQYDLLTPYEWASIAGCDSLMDFLQKHGAVRPFSGCVAHSGSPQPITKGREVCCTLDCCIS